MRLMRRISLVLIAPLCMDLLMTVATKRDEVFVGSCAAFFSGHNMVVGQVETVSYTAICAAQARFLVQDHLQAVWYVLRHELLLLAGQLILCVVPFATRVPHRKLWILEHVHGAVGRA